jgi:hypothetical protein
VANGGWAVRTAIFVLLMGATAQGWCGSPFVSGNELSQWCEGEFVDACRGYMTGVWDTLLFAKEVSPTAFTTVCLPEGTILASQLQKLWIKWSNEHPEQLHHAAAGLVLTAFVDAWSCN